MSSTDSSQARCHAAGMLESANLNNCCILHAEIAMRASRNVMPISKIRLRPAYQFTVVLASANFLVVACTSAISTSEETVAASGSIIEEDSVNAVERFEAES